MREAAQPEREIERFVYDSTGNLLRRGEGEFRYEQPDRLTRTDDATLIYDEVGNLIEKRRAGSTVRYSYDSDNRLVAVESKEGGRVEFAYDAFGRRIAKNTKDGETGFLWDGDVLLAEQCGDRSSEYLFALESHEPLCRFDESKFETYHNDHLGTPRELSDARGQIVWSANYDVYGRISRLETDETGNDIRFQGQYADAETGLYYNRFRYYSPDIERYITADPIGIIGGTNGYSYTRNPVNWIDPLGLTDLVKYPIRPELTPWREARQTGINRAWRQERELVRTTGSGTRDWTPAELNELLTTGRVVGYTGHHINNVEQFPAWAGDPRNIRFLSTQPAGGDHLRSPQGHRGNFANQTRGRLIDRERMMEQHRRQNNDC